MRLPPSYSYGIRDSSRGIDIFMLTSASYKAIEIFSGLDGPKWGLLALNLRRA